MRYTNPVLGDYFADPFVWQSGGDYFAIGTGPEEAAVAVAAARQPSIFPLLTSRDLIRWERIGRALVRPDAAFGDSFWAPEVAQADGRFYLYYSVGHGDPRHQLRVAVSHEPAGPYEDANGLTHVEEVPFAIDPHPFRDDDGRWYLFHARDMLETQPGEPHRAGTALVVHELESMTQLSRQGATVLRPRCDWQRFAAARPIYGQIYDWHTLEGPCVLKHAGSYLCLYSGGCWQTDTYGVDFAVAAQVLGPYDDRGSEGGPRVLKTIPGHVIGPGHCSVVRGPDRRTLVIVYHAWDPAMGARSMRIDELHLGADGPRSSGPSFSPRELPVR